VTAPTAGALLVGEILYSGGDLGGGARAWVHRITRRLRRLRGIRRHHPIFGENLAYTFTQPVNLVFYAILRLLCGLVGRVHTTAFYKARGFFSSLRIPRFVKPVIGLALSGVIGIFFPEVWGLGYGFLQYLIDGNLNLIGINFFTLPIIVVLLLVAVFKIVATALTVGSGGGAAREVFAPSLVIGGFLSAAFWVVINQFFPGAMPAPPRDCGDDGLFADVGRVPILVILMVGEMTGSLALGPEEVPLRELGVEGWAAASAACINWKRKGNQSPRPLPLRLAELQCSPPPSSVNRPSSQAPPCNQTP
jgi:chloride channel protein, CIC family